MSSLFLLSVRQPRIQSWSAANQNRKTGRLDQAAETSYLISVHVGMNISGANDLTCYYDNSYES
jgi:hypothetical protein